MKIDYDYLDRIRRLVEICSKRKTSDILDGDYRSNAHGKSLDFDDLAEYHYGDDVKDIDWKSSSRTGKTLIRRYFADRKHDVLFVCDTSDAMQGDTPNGEAKHEIALMTFGVAAYILGKQGASYSVVYSKEKGTYLSAFSSGSNHLENLLYSFKKGLEEGKASKSVAQILKEVSEKFSRKLIIILITDTEGLLSVNEDVLKRVNFKNDLYVFKIEDAMLTSYDSFDMDASKKVDVLLSMNKKLHDKEVALKNGMDRKIEKTFAQYPSYYMGISREEDIIDTLIDLFKFGKGMKK